MRRTPCPPTEHEAEVGARFDLLNPQTYDWLRELVDTVVARTLRRSERYTDDFAALATNPAHQGPVAVASGTADPVFSFGGDQPEVATNTVAEQGRRLRRRRWGFWSVIAVLVLAFWIYNDAVAPIFGLPRLDDH